MWFLPVGAMHALDPTGWVTLTPNLCCSLRGIISPPDISPQPPPHSTPILKVAGKVYPIPYPSNYLIHLTFLYFLMIYMCVGVMRCPQSYPQDRAPRHLPHTSLGNFRVGRVEG